MPSGAAGHRKVGWNVLVDVAGKPMTIVAPSGVMESSIYSGSTLLQHELGQALGSQVVQRSQLQPRTNPLALEAAGQGEGSVSNPWIWSTCTAARLWADVLTSASGWLATRATANCPASGPATPICSGDGDACGTESTSASSNAGAESTAVTSTTRVPGTWSATRSG